MNLRLFPFLGLLAFLWSLAATAISAQEVPLRLTGKTDSTDFAGFIQSLRDPDGLLTPEQAEASDFTRQASGAIDFGYTTDKIWLRLDLENGTDAQDWRIRYRENFFQEFAVYQVAPDGTVTVLESLGETSPFSARKVPFAELAVAFKLDPGERTTILTRYRSGGSSELSFTVMPATDFAAFEASITARNFAFYGMMMLLIIAATALYALQGQFVFAAYACYATSALLFVMHGDGNAFRFLWPNAPLFNGFASIVLGTALIVFGANFVRHYLQTKDHNPVLETLLRLTLVGGLALFAASAVIDHQLIKKTLILAAFLSVILFTIAGLVVARTRFREVRFYLLAWLGALISSGIMTGRHYLGFEITEEVQYNSLRVVLVVDAAMMGFAIIDRINQIKRAQQQALERSLAEARRNLRLSDRLQGLERKIALAQDLAQSQSRQVADTLHDLRGPLHALRLNLQDASRGNVAPSADIENTLSYLETLVSDEMRRHTDGPRQAPPPEPEAESVDINTVLTAVFDMFVAEAREKGLHLRAVPTSATTTVPPFALMRILSNLVSNAVRYTDQGRILFGVRRGGHLGLRIEIHDTGPGLNSSEFAQALARADRLERDDDQGHGLGLAIVQEAVETHNLGFGLLPGRVSGTGLYVTLR